MVNKCTNFFDPTRTGPPNFSCLAQIHTFMKSILKGFLGIKLHIFLKISLPDITIGKFPFPGIGTYNL